MKIAYLILAHNNPRVLTRAIAQLSTDDCAFFIHIDRKSNIDDFSAIQGQNIYYCDHRVPVYWGDFSQVEAILTLLRTAQKHQPDYYLLISGSDYPLRSGRYIHDFLEANRGLEFINLVKVPAPGKPLSRINTLRYPRSKPVRHLVSRALAKIGLAQRNCAEFLGGVEPYSGGTWWCLTSEACQYVLDFVDRNRGFVRFFEDMFAPDEAFFHTILANSRFRSKIRRNLHYEDWSEQGSHPAFIEEKHVTLLRETPKVYVKDNFGNGEVLFARKFSENNQLVLDLLDEMIVSKDRDWKRETQIEADSIKAVL
jgi:hypothetical protein